MEMLNQVRLKPYQIRLGRWKLSLPLLLFGTVVSISALIYTLDGVALWLFERKALRIQQPAAHPEYMPLSAEILDRGLLNTPFSSDKGNLPTDEISLLFKDPTGIIWAGSSRGLLQFNGSSFQSIDIVQSFDGYYPNLRPTAVTGDERGQLYIYYHGIGLCVYDRHAKAIKRLSTASKDLPFRLRTTIFKTGPYVYYSSTSDEANVEVCNLESGQVTQLPHSISGQFMDGKEPGMVSFYSSDTLRERRFLVTYRSHLLLEEQELEWFEFEHNVAISEDSVYLFRRQEPRTLLHDRVSTTAVPINLPGDDDPHFRLLGNILEAHFDPVHKEIYLSHWGGISIFDPYNRRLVGYPFRSIDSLRFTPLHSQVACMTRDHFGNLWMGFYAQGIARLELANTMARNHLTPQELGGEKRFTINNIVEADNGDILLLTKDGIIVTDQAFRSRKKVQDIRLSPISCNTNWITNLQPLSDTTFLVGSWGNPPTIFEYRNGEWAFQPQRHLGPLSAVCGIFNKNIFRWGDFWLFSSWGLGDPIQATDLEGRRYFRQLRDRHGNTVGPSNLNFGILQDGEDLWMHQTDVGLAYYKLGAKPNASNIRGDTLFLDAEALPVPLSPSLGEDFRLTDIITMKKLSGGRICIVAVSGIYIKDGPYLEKTEVPALENKVLRCLAEDPATGNIWIGTSQGLYSFSSDLSTPLQFIDAINGMQSSSVHELYFLRDGRLVADTKQGLSVIGPRFMTGLPPAIHLTQVQFNGQAAIPLDQVYHADPGTRQVLLSLFTTQYHAIASNEIRYAINKEKDWIEAGKGPTFYLNLPYGRHQLNLQARHLNGVDIGPVYPLFLHMPAPWYASWWFRFFLLGIFISSIILYRFEKRYADRKMRDMTETIQYLRLQTIHAQMNPHFIFNTLGTMQYFILNNDALSANRLLVRLSRLIRNYLDASVKSSFSGTGLMRNEISLRQELDLIDDYMEFEMIQLNQSFQFITDIDPHIDPDAISLPPMLIQPFLENAVKHGVTYKEEDGLILLKIRHMEDGLAITIRDNGIGREASRKKQEDSLKSYRSYGSDLVRHKVALLNELGYQISVEYTDLEPGLEVHIFIHH